MFRRASRPLIGGLRTAAILRRLQSFTSQAEDLKLLPPSLQLTEGRAQPQLEPRHLKNYKETTIIVIQLDNGDFIVGSDSRRTVSDDFGTFIVSDVVNKVEYLASKVLVARAGSVYDLKRCVCHMLTANFSIVSECLENVINKGCEYVNWLSCNRTFSFIVMGYVNGISHMFRLLYSKKKDSRAIRKLVKLSGFCAIGSGATYLIKYVKSKLRNLNVECTLKLVEIGLLLACLNDPSTGGRITVRLFTPKGVEELSQNTVLGIVEKYYGLFAESYERSILLVFKMLVVECGADEYLVPDVDVELLKRVIEREKGLRAVDNFGHPLASLCDGFYLQMVRFVEVESVDCIMRMAQEVPDKELLFAYSSCGVKKLNVGGKSVFVMPSTRSNLGNLKGYLPPIDYSL